MYELHQRLCVDHASSVHESLWILHVCITSMLLCSLNITCRSHHCHYHHYLQGSRVTVFACILHVFLIKLTHFLRLQFDMRFPVCVSAFLVAFLFSTLISKLSVPKNFFYIINAPYGIVSAKRDLTHVFFKISNSLTF